MTDLKFSISVQFWGALSITSCGFFFSVMVFFRRSKKLQLSFLSKSGILIVTIGDRQCQFASEKAVGFKLANQLVEGMIEKQQVDVNSIETWIQC